MIEEIINKININDILKNIDLWNSDLTEEERKNLLDNGNIF